MSPFLLTSLVCLSCLSCHLVTSYPFGAPACVSSPRHGPEPQTSELELKITRDVTQDGDIRLQLGHPQSDSTFTFRGFLVKTTAPGEFLLTEESSNVMAKLECSGILGSAGPDTRAVTHSHAGEKHDVQLLFRPEEGAQLDPEFDIIVLRNYTTFWAGITI